MGDRSKILSHIPLFGESIVPFGLKLLALMGRSVLNDFIALIFEAYFLDILKHDITGKLLRYLLGVCLLVVLELYVEKLLVEIKQDLFRIQVGSKILNVLLIQAINLFHDVFI